MIYFYDSRYLFESIQLKNIHVSHLDLRAHRSDHHIQDHLLSRRGLNKEMGIDYFYDVSMINNNWFRCRFIIKSRTFKIYYRTNEINKLSNKIYTCVI